MYARKFKLPLGNFRPRLKKIFSSRSFFVKSGSNEAGHNRFAIVISSKFVKKATRRNFWKRAVAEEVRKWPNFQKDFLFIVLRPIEEIEPRELKKEINDFLKECMVMTKK